MKDLKVIFMGTPDFAVPILEYLIQNTSVMLVITKPDTNKNGKPSFSPVKVCALKNNIDVITPSKIKDETEIISELNPDLIVTAAYGKIIPEAILNIPRLGALNVHGSLLPKYRGASPIQTSLLNNDKVTGISLMYMDKEMDTGDVISQKEVIIDEDDNVKTLFEKMSFASVELLKDTLPLIKDGKNNRIKQDNNLATYTKMLTREDEHLNFNEKGNTIIGKIRALYPNAYFILNNMEVKVLKAKFVSGKEENKNGLITIKNKKLMITCQDGQIEIEIIKPFGKKEMNAQAYLNGNKNIDNQIVE